MPRTRNPVQRTERFQIMLSIDERKQLDALAHAAGLNRSTYVRERLLAEHPPPPPPPPLVDEAGEALTHYIVDSRSYVGNCVLFWCPNGAGYTCCLDDAGLYTEADAKSRRDTDIPVPRAVAERAVVRHVRVEHLAQAGIDFTKKRKRR